MKKNQSLSTFGLFVLTFAVSLLTGLSQAWSYMSVMNTGEILDPGEFRAIVEPQLLVYKQNGGEVVARFDTGLSDSLNVRALVGTGTIDFSSGVFLKWIPIPDHKKQPAVGADFGVTYARYDGEGETSVRVHPLMSKRIEANYGLWTPYASLPTGIAARKGVSVVPVHLAVGSQFQSNEWKNLQFMGELGINIVNSFSYISAGLLFYFDDTRGFHAN